MLENAFKQCLLNFTVPKNYLESMLKHRFLVSIPRGADFTEDAQEFVFLLSSQVMLGYTSHSTEPEELTPARGALPEQVTKTSWPLLSSSKKWR